MLKGNQSSLSCPEVSVLEGPWGGCLRMWGLVVFKKCHEEIWEANCCMGLFIYNVNNWFELKCWGTLERVDTSLYSSKETRNKKWCHRPGIWPNDDGRRELSSCILKIKFNSCSCDMKVLHVIWKRGCGNKELAHTVCRKKVLYLWMSEILSQFIPLVYPVKSNAQYWVCLNSFLKKQRIYITINVIMVLVKSINQFGWIYFSVVFIDGTIKMR